MERASSGLRAGFARVLAINSSNDDPDCAAATSVASRRSGAAQPATIKSMTKNTQNLIDGDVTIFEQRCMKMPLVGSAGEGQSNDSNQRMRSSVPTSKLPPELNTPPPRRPCD